VKSESGSEFAGGGEANSSSVIKTFSLTVMTQSSTRQS
jgi:hypothetical protein